MPIDRRIVIVALVVAVLAGVATAAALQQSHHSGASRKAGVARPEIKQSPSPSRSGPAAAPVPHFATPESAMRYLAAAWNANNLTNLKHVTDPGAREQLIAMHSEASQLRLDHCVKRSAGDYDCFFTHSFPNTAVQRREDTDSDGIGHAEFLVGPADRPGWYMTVYVSCGG